MSESNPDRSNSYSDVKEENEALMHRDIEKSPPPPPPHHCNKELTSHGMRDDIDEKTPLRDVVFERAKEDIDAPPVQTIHHKKESQTNGTSLAESKPDSLSDVKAPNIFERVIVHTEKSPHHHKETHGMRDDIDENTPLNDVKAPNMFEPAKEEIEAFVQTIHPKKESQTKGRRGEAIMAESKTYLPISENDVKSPNSIERAKQGSEATMHAEKSPVHHRHHKETHGMSDDIDEKTPIDEVKGPNVFERAKEELEALVQTIHPKKDSDIHVSSSNKDGGFKFFIGRGLEKVCRPWGTKKN